MFFKFGVRLTSERMLIEIRSWMTEHVSNWNMGTMFVWCRGCLYNHWPWLCLSSLVSSLIISPSSFLLLCSLISSSFIPKLKQRMFEVVCIISDHDSASPLHSSLNIVPHAFFLCGPCVCQKSASYSSSFSDIEGNCFSSIFFLFSFWNTRMKSLR